MHINFLEQLFKKWLGDYKQRGYNGIAKDPRSKDEKEKDWSAYEVYTLASGQTFSPFREVSLGDWAYYLPRNQGKGSSCVANSMAKILEIKRRRYGDVPLKFSHAPIYKKRANSPGPGMWLQNALQITKDISSCPEHLYPSELMTDEEIDARPLPVNYEDINNYVKPNSYLNDGFLPFDLVANMVNKEKAVTVLISSDDKHYTHKAIPEAGGKNGNISHAITVVDAIKLDGVEYLVAEDSWGINFIDKVDPLSSLCSERGQRLFTRGFWNDAVYGIGVLTRFEYDVKDSNETNKSEPFYNVLAFGDNNYDVKRLQEYLKKKGYFPSNTDTTTYYGNITARAVYAFQTANNVASPSELLALQGKRVGQKTLDFINKNL